MKMEPVQTDLAWTKPTLRRLSLAEVIQMLDRENARRQRADPEAAVKSYRA